MSEEKKHLKLPKNRYNAEITRKGGALYALIPSEIANFLGVSEGDRIVYLKDMKNKTVLILNPEKVKIMIEGIGPAGIGFTIPKKLLEKIESKKG